MVAESHPERGEHLHSIQSLTSNEVSGEMPAKRKRGRPRKYPEGYKNKSRGNQTLDFGPSGTDTSSPAIPSRSANARSVQDLLTTNINLPSVCPVCNGVLPWDEIDASAHVEECLQRQKEPKPVAKPVQLDDSLVNVLDGDESRYGRPQYSDRDVASVLSGISAAIESQESSTSSLPLRRDNVEALLQTVKLQDQIIQRIPRCLICLDPHRKPVVSTVCWHVFCETCWLQSLSSKRVCPHCSTITSPEDLRRVYM